MPDPEEDEVILPWEAEVPPHQRGPQEGRQVAPRVRRVRGPEEDTPQAGA